jgi:hypothetical protein
MMRVMRVTSKVHNPPGGHAVASALHGGPKVEGGVGAGHQLEHRRPAPRARVHIAHLPQHEASVGVSPPLVMHNPDCLVERHPLCYCCLPADTPQWHMSCLCRHGRKRGSAAHCPLLDAVPAAHQQPHCKACLDVHDLVVQPVSGTACNRILTILHCIEWSATPCRGGAL